jgi:hypothetical protein
MRRCGSALAVLGRLGMRGSIVGQNEMALYSVLFETHDEGEPEHLPECQPSARDVA